LDKYLNALINISFVARIYHKTVPDILLNADQQLVRKKTSP